MLSIKKILVPTDFSECARHALDYAIELARGRQTEIVLLHVVEPLITIAPLGMEEETKIATETAMSGLAGDHLASLTEETRREMPCVRPLLKEGLAAREIIAVAREEKVDLIVMGSFGRSGVIAALLGSKAAQVTRRAPCSVLVVRPKGREEPAA